MHTAIQQGEAYLDILSKALADKVRERLKKPLMQLAEKEIDGVIAEATKDLEYSIKQYRHADIMKDTVEVVLTDKRKP